MPSTRGGSGCVAEGMVPAEVIERKRDGHELTAGELAAFLEGYLSGSVADYQVSAFLMRDSLKIRARDFFL